MEKPSWQRPDVSGQQPASEKLRPANSHRSDLGRGSSPNQALRTAILLDTLVVALYEETLSQRHPSQLHPES